MARCKQCGASSLFLRVNGNGLCPDCAERDKELRLSIMENGRHRNEEELPKLSSVIGELISSVDSSSGLDFDSIKAAFQLLQRAVDAETNLAEISLTASIAELEKQNQVADNLLSEAKVAINALADKAKADSPSETPSNTAADEIMKYKQLLDAGAISQEEYDAKKKQLLTL